MLEAEENGEEEEKEVDELVPEDLEVLFAQWESLTVMEPPLDRVVRGARPTSGQQLDGRPVYGFVGSATFRCIAPIVRADLMAPRDRAAMAPVSRISRQFFHGSFSLWDPRLFIGDAGSCTYRCVSASVYRNFLWPELSVYLQHP